MLVGVAIWVRVAFVPWFAGRVDQSGRRRTAILAMAWLAVAAVVPFAWAHGFWELLWPSLCFGLTYPVLIPLHDSLTELCARRVPGLRYARMRLYGSAAFLLTVVLLGQLLERSGTDLVLWTLIGALAATGVCAAFLPAPGIARPPRGGRPVRELLSNRAFVAVLVATAVVQSSHGAYYAFSTLHWTGAGVSAGTVGLLWAEGVIAEIALFAFGASWAERLGSRRLLLIGAGAGVVRWAALASTTAGPALFAVNWLHALSFGATHLGAIGFVQRRIAGERSATAQSLLSAISTGAGMALSTMAAGVLYERFAGGAFWGMVALAVVGAAVAWRGVRGEADAT